MRWPSPQSRSRHPSERRGLGEKEEKKEVKKKISKGGKRGQFWSKSLAKQGLTRDMCLSSTNLPRE